MGLNKVVLWISRGNIQQWSLMNVGRFFELFIIFSSLGLAVLVGISCVVPGEISVTSQGTLEPLCKILVRSKTSGVVEQILVEEGDVVRKGDTLVIVDNDGILAEIARINQEIAITENLLKISQLELQETINQNKVTRDELLSMITKVTMELETDISLYRFEQEMQPEKVDSLLPDSRLEPQTIRQKRIDLELLMNKLSSMKSYSVESKHNEAQAHEIRIVQLRKQMEFLQEKLTETAIIAPEAGTVLMIDPDRLLGDLLATGQPVCCIADLSDWCVRAYVQEKDRPRICVDQRARISIVALSEMSYGYLDGEVKEISLSKIVSDEAPNVYQVIIAIPNRQDNDRIPFSALKDGMTAKVRITVEKSSLFKIVAKKYFLKTI